MLPKIKHFQNIVATAQKSIPFIFKKIDINGIRSKDRF